MRGRLAVREGCSDHGSVQKLQWNPGAGDEFFRDADVTHPDDAGDIGPFPQEQPAFGTTECHGHECLDGRSENFA